MRQRNPLITIVDNHPIARLGLSAIARRSTTHCDIIEFYKACQITATYKRYVAIDLLILDIQLPNVCGLELIDQLKRINASIPIISMSNDCRAETAKAALMAGASYFAPISTTADVFQQLIRTALGIPPGDAPATQTHSTTVLGDVPLTDADDPPLINKTQHSVLKLLALGLSNKEIANAIHLAEGTVKNHITKILRELKVDNRTQLIAKATSVGLIKQHVPSQPISRTAVSA